MLYIENFQIDSYCLVDENGCYLEDPSYEDDILTFDDYLELNELYFIREWSSWSIVDKKSGYFLTRRAFDNVLWFHRELGAVGKSEDGHRPFQYGLIDGKGHTITTCQWDDIEFFWNGQSFDLLGKVEKARKWGFIDREGHEVIPARYDAVSFFREGLAAVRIDGKWGYIDETGNTIIPCEYNCADPFCDGTAVVQQGRESFEIDKTGRKIKKAETQSKYFTFDEDLVPVKCHGKWGFIDTQGNPVIDCEWDYVKSFEDGLCEVSQEGLPWGLIDRAGNLVYPCICGDWDDVRNHLLCSRRNELNKC